VFLSGYWHAREPEFFEQAMARVFEWLRLPGDALFIVGGILPVTYLAVRMWIHRKRAGKVPLGEAREAFVQPRQAA